VAATELQAVVFCSFRASWQVREIPPFQG